MAILFEECAKPLVPLLEDPGLSGCQMDEQHGLPIDEFKYQGRQSPARERELAGRGSHAGDYLCPVNVTLRMNTGSQPRAVHGHASLEVLKVPYRDVIYWRLETVLSSEMEGEITSWGVLQPFP